MNHEDIHNPFLGLENGRPYWEGSGIGRGGIEGMTVYEMQKCMLKYFLYNFYIRVPYYVFLYNVLSLFNGWSPKSSFLVVKSSLLVESSLLAKSSLLVKSLLLVQGVAQHFSQS